MGLARYKDKKGIQSFTLEPESAIQEPSDHLTGPTLSSAGAKKKHTSSSAKPKNNNDASDDVPTIDEPLILLHLASYYNSQEDLRMYKFFGERIRETWVKHNGWENYVAICMLRFFAEERPLTELFAFEQRRTARGRRMRETRFSGRRGKIVGVVPHSSRSFVGVGCLSENLGFSCGNGNQRPQPNLGYSSRTVQATRRWVKTGQAGGLLFPDNSMGPDILFLLQLDNAELVWVAVQCKYNTPTAQTFAPATQVKKSCIRSTTPDFYYMPDSEIRMAQDHIEANENELVDALRSVKQPSDITGEVASHTAETPILTLTTAKNGAMSDNNTEAVQADVDGESELTALSDSDTESDPEDYVSEGLYGYLLAPPSTPRKDQAHLSVSSGKRRIGETSATVHAPEDAERRNKKSRGKSRR
ncbi:uncharacterized protein SCHCODRAFT_0257354 [Schizophyllum commune H4-8]|uniref:Uncharacterized protein n=1 Tax=Schizophyllum commune (strain H4-8 / FGSC 9210) TaxID=578458 RepID=D8Q6Y5_SCHCM|nr:uncharacterized protein SCHCODRAFT_0257354 [Schizophyllum commune H4-8]KAI5891719.1 hypothetical protein SCHCODRAFT_0257354 [Schizophyllum commune H4-8]